MVIFLIFATSFSVIIMWVWFLLALAPLVHSLEWY